MAYAGEYRLPLATRKPVWAVELLMCVISFTFDNRKDTTVSGVPPDPYTYLAKRTLATITIAAALVASGLLGAVATAASASPPKLSAMLLSIGQMPTGWSVDNSSGSKMVLGCFTSTFLEPKGIKQTAKATVSFDGNSGLP
jgi:predicted secreted protein